MTRDAKTWRYMAEWAESKANTAAASNEPWAMHNLRLYQNKASEFWSEHYKAKHAEELDLKCPDRECSEHRNMNGGCGLCGAPCL